MASLRGSTAMENPWRIFPSLRVTSLALGILEMNLIQRTGGDALFAHDATVVWKEGLCADGRAAPNCGLRINQNTARIPLVAALEDDFISYLMAGESK